MVSTYPCHSTIVHKWQDASHIITVLCITFSISASGHIMCTSVLCYCHQLVHFKKDCSAHAISASRCLMCAAVHCASVLGFCQQLMDLYIILYVAMSCQVVSIETWGIIFNQIGIIRAKLLNLCGSSDSYDVMSISSMRFSRLITRCWNGKRL